MVEARTWTRDDAARSLLGPTASDDKYSRGVVGLRTGSGQYPGAAVIGVEAAWRTGVGMVRYVGPTRASDLVLHRRPETVTVDGRVQAWVVGSGTDPAERTDAETAALRGILAGEVPVVVDAGALGLAIGASAPLVVTPHDREHVRLRSELGLADAGPDRVAAACETARALGGTVLLKGAETIVATPAGWTALVASGTPWLATAGTGDVLAGVLGGLVAVAQAHGGPQDDEALGPLAASAAWLHGRAATVAAASLGPAGGPITALDVADSLPGIVSGLLTRR
ncbi:ADP-dependent NAD(P)H-hydrate dehydratase [Microbacterium ulmi]|uniref:ADP-dependent (S)-NAD(P)H-hydrate dehydratase n=1 Tax=Microbacterium ulmi TaxID=179095 RepID=A0A7Y2M1T8_9MICO|nr:ADP/ATP-dependent (S)-NAD(P)H-hydrate dehydratase [Microbacterium ulmi]NII70440.1 hydroxyethylthiazole kinase-like uncharacterized protein yjeF [Microbacterium ulmi]NNH04429.1 NAD(P)H-hydrate dehydratase [Microbacterium ulmi]